MLWSVLAGTAAALLGTWLVLVVALLVARPDRSVLTEAVRILPDVVRLLRRLATDRRLPRGLRVRLSLLLVYLAMPIDLVPDVIPLVGQADDVIIAVAVLRSVVRRAGVDVIRRHWTGTDRGFAALCRLCGVPAGD